MIEHSDDFYNCECPICGKRFHLKPSKLNLGKTHYCSRKCHRIAKMEYMKGDGNHQYGLKGSLNATWRSDEKISQYGYKLIRVLDHPFKDNDGFVFEHRLIAEKYLLNEENSIEIDGKRYLKPDYVVHHKDFRRLNNRVENLQVMTFSEHQSYHAKLNPRERDEYGHFIKNDDDVKVKRVTETAVMPSKATEGSAGYDLYADIEEEIVIPPQSTRYIRSGLAFQIPKMHVGMIFARSGLSTNKGLRPSTCVSVIDSDYRGEVGLPMYNDSMVEQHIHPHERIAQLIIQEILPVKFIQVNKLDETERGENGFGSSGK